MAVAVILLTTPPGWAQPGLLLDNATIITGDGALLENSSVLVEDGMIVSVLPAAEATLPIGATRIDLTGRFLMPALIDGHAHLGYQSPADWGADNYTRENLISNLRQYAYYGFGAVFSAGTDPDDFALALQAEQRQGGEATSGTARLIFAAGMGPPGQGPNDAFLEQAERVADRLDMNILRGVASPEEAIMQVRAVAEKDIPFIKIWVDDRGGSQTRLPADHYLPLIAEAMRQRIKVVVHQQRAADMPPLLDAGASGFLHGRLGPELGPEIAAAMARARAFLVPNLGLGELRQETIGRDPFLQPVLPSSALQRLTVGGGTRMPSPTPAPEREAELRESLGRLLNAGVDIVLGTDAGALPDHPFGYTGHRELEIFVRLGMTPMQALVAATGDAARSLDQADLGVVEAGRRADLLVLNNNPLVDIRNTRSIEAVLIGGQRINRQSVAESLRTAETQ